ncbi:MAG: type II secretion system protein, partial [Ruminococcaceae bacterium]|nr:type II secretion system protein [Oscillospiraceae bacterium]
MKRQLHSRKGVTVAEVVIALVIIAAISAFTLSLIVMSIGVETKSESAIEVKNAAENAIECFRFAKSEEGL